MASCQRPVARFWIQPKKPNTTTPSSDDRITQASNPSPLSLLACRRIAVIEHTRCAMASADDAGIARLVGDATGFDTSAFTPGAIADQRDRIAADLQRIHDHALIGDDVEVAGFVYDVDTGLLEQVA